MFRIYVRCVRCWVATSGLTGFWCVFFWVYSAEHRPRPYGYYESGAFLLIYMSDLFIVCKATWHVSICFYICIINHLLQNTTSLSASYLNLFIVCVPCSGHASSAARGSRSTGIVEQGAELVMVYVCVAREVSISASFLLTESRQYEYNRCLLCAGNTRTIK